jgi:hypothetical protein
LTFNGLHGVISQKTEIFEEMVNLKKENNKRKGKNDRRGKINKDMRMT